MTVAEPPAFPVPRAAYVHVPFCRHRCGYCNFTLVAGRDDLIAAYLAALRQELSWLRTSRPVETLFLGGGTPTHLPPNALRELFAVVREWLPLAAGGEFSVEANPLDLLVDERLRVLSDAGVNRISLGVQSFDDRKLAVLERDHRREQIAAAFANARQCAQSVAVDLIFGAPGETLAAWREDLDAALALRPDHVSTYGLTIERGTQFWNRQQRSELQGVDEETERQMYEAAIDALTAAGWEHYEVSNFARPGRPCRHNEAYWLGESYYAAGPGAARFVEGVREMNHRSTTTWINRVLAGQSPVAERESLPPRERAKERLVFALRRLEGISLTLFQRQSAFAVSELVGEILPRMVEHGLLEQQEDTLKLTRRGLLVSDAIWTEFLRQ